MNDTQPQGGRITAIEPQKRRPDRISLYLDGRFACGLSERVAQDAGLHIGKDLGPDDLAALLGDEETCRAFNAAYLLLSYRARSRAEIEKRLAQKGYPPSLVERVMDDLSASGLLDDSAFAEGWVRNRRQTKPRGKSLLRYELRQKGIPRETADSVLEAIGAEEEVAGARAVAQRFLEREKNADPVQRRRRAIGLLQRRGYGWETIREALGALEDLRDEGEPFIE